MKRGFQYFPIGGFIEVLGFLTLFTNEESVLPYLDLGFEAPVYLISADIQGVLLIALGSLVTGYGILKMSRQ